MNVYVPKKAVKALRLVALMLFASAIVNALAWWLMYLESFNR